MTIDTEDSGQFEEATSPSGAVLSGLGAVTASEDPANRAQTLNQNVAPDDEDLIDRMIAEAGGVATLIMTTVFNEVALPPGFAEKFASQMVLANRSAGDWSIGNGAGRVDEKTKEEREQDANEAAWAYVDSMLDMEEERQQRDREEAARAEQWLGADHSFAGQTMSGAEWKAMSDWFKNTENNAAWEDAMMAETGQSREEVRRTGGKMKRMYDLIDLQAQGKTLTPEQKAEQEALSNDSAVKTGMDVAKRRMDMGREQATSVELASQTVISKNDSINAGIGLIAEQADLSNEGFDEPKVAITSLAARSDVPRGREDLSVAKADFKVDPLLPQFNPAAEGVVPASIPSPGGSAPIQRVQVAMTAGLDAG